MRESSSCTDALRWRTTMHRLLDGEASSTEERSLRVHLDECPECSHVWGDLSWVVGAVRGLGPGSATADSALVEPSSSIDTLATSSAPATSVAPAPRTPALRLRWGSAAAAALLLGLVLWSVPPIDRPNDADSPGVRSTDLARVEDETHPRPEDMAIQTPSTVEVVSTSDDLLVVPVDSLDPSVQIVWLYETHPRKVGTP